MRKRPAEYTDVSPTILIRATSHTDGATPVKSSPSVTSETMSTVPPSYTTRAVGSITMVDIPSVFHAP